MNRTQRAIKKQHRRIQSSEKRAQYRARQEAKAELLNHKSFAKTAANERKLKRWHREILNDYASKNENREVRTA